MQALTIKRYGQKNAGLFQALHACSLWQRLRGLLARPTLKAGEGLLITPCSSVHTVGMRYALDLVFLDKGGRVVKCVTDLKTYRVAAARKAQHVLELPVGSISAANIVVGDRLDWVAVQEAVEPKSKDAC